jgi:hypothetical protein
VVGTGGVVCAEAIAVEVRENTIEAIRMVVIEKANTIRARLKFFMP